MLNNKKVLVNAISSAFQVAIVGVVYFLQYKYLLSKLGVQELGVWSLVMATSSIVNLANFGITSSLVKFVAEYKANRREEELSTLITTSLISICCFFLILVSLLYFGASFVLKNVVDSKYLPLAKEILPYSLLSLFIVGIGGVFTSVLEGVQKNYLRSIIYSGATIFQYMLIVLLLPQYGILGVSYAQILQSCLILIAAIYLSFRYFWNKDVSLFQWKKTVFKEIISYGLKLQVVSICQMMYEPTTKALLSKFGGLSMVGYYEMASRMITQIRALIINANQVIIPVVAEVSINNNRDFGKIHGKTLFLTILVSLTVILLIIVLTPLISAIWIGHVENSFIFFTVILCVANFVNINSGPAYFILLGQGKLNPIIYEHIVIGILNALLAYLLGLYYGGVGVVLSWAFALSVPSFLLIYYFDKVSLHNQLITYGKTIYSSIFFFTCIVMILIFSAQSEWLSRGVIIFTLFGMLFYAGLLYFFFYKNTDIQRIIRSILHMLKK